MPVIALRGLTVLPTMMIHFDISRRKSVTAMEKAMVSDQKVFLLTQRSPDVAEPELKDLYHIGTIAEVKQLVKMPGNTVRVMVEGTQMGEILSLSETDPMMMGEVARLPYERGLNSDFASREAMARILKEKLVEYGQVNPKFGHDVVPNLLLLQDLDELMLQIAVQMPWDYTVRQEYLEAIFSANRYEVLVRHLMNEVEIAHIRQEFQEKVKDAINKNQKDYILREQMRLIREELGEENPSTEANEYRRQLEDLKADRETKDKLRKEISRFESMPAASQEANVLRMYIETLLELPWKKTSRDNNDIVHAEEILNEDHYGLEKVKERVLEYLAVRTLTKKGNGPILCLVGPPGTGKTSIARSVARALNKKYIRISLGGVRDEAEIRGHRKTYVGAMPGRIVEGLRQAGVSNPLMLLDEIDKVGSDYKGDTSSALLEVLDGDQNVRFRDHYVETPIDLSQVLFIATANTTQTIPRPLLDRMEVIEVSSYTENEKFHIGRDYLVSKQLERNGLKENQLTISDGALKKIIHNYTREAGVRNLERCIGEICRKAAREYLESQNRSAGGGAGAGRENSLGGKMRMDRRNAGSGEGAIAGRNRDSGGKAGTNQGGDSGGKVGVSQDEDSSERANVSKDIGSGGKMRMDRRNAGSGVRADIRLESVSGGKARAVLQKGSEAHAIRVTESNLEKYLGKERISFEDANEEDQVGVVRGLAWTSVGGDTLQIEVNTMPGKGELQMTGQLGDVMKESAQIALTYVRSVCPRYGVNDDYFEKHNLHIHIPDGAVPKDGPSAGITMATAMLSAVTGRPVDCKLAMTGEITLRGRVLPVGGLKEKILAAKMAHIRRVLVPYKNRPDIAELSKEITRGLTILYVKDMDEVIREAFVEDDMGNESMSQQT